jgi:hypothetical protein
MKLLLILLLAVVISLVIPASSLNLAMAEQAQNQAGNDDDDLPTCKNGVVQDCKVKGGITCIVKERDDPCMDIWYGLTGGGWPECCDGRDDKDNDDKKNK